MTIADLNDDCKPDIASAAEASDEEIRVTWNQCDSGDVNNDDFVDGDDIQTFVDTYINPSAASWHDFNRADMNQDHVLDSTDVQLLVKLLLGLPCDNLCPSTCCPCGLSYAYATASAPSSEPSADSGGSSGLDALNKCVSAYPRRKYAKLSDREYLLLILKCMCDDGFDDFCTFYKIVENWP